MEKLSRQQIEEMLQKRPPRNTLRFDEATGTVIRFPDNKQKRLLNLSGYDLSGLDLSGLDLSDVDLSDSNLSNANLSRANLDCSILDRANLDYADVSEAEMIETSLKNVDLRKVNLKDALSSPYLFGAILTGMDLSGIGWPKQYLQDLDLRNVNFSEANLEESDLSGANLEGVNFQSAYLRSVNFSECNLKQADFQNANLTSADFSSADLQNAKLQKAKLDRIKYNTETKWPDDFSVKIPTKKQTKTVEPLINPINNEAFKKDKDLRLILQPYLKIDKVGFSMDGKILATGHSFYGIKFWDIETGKELLTLPNSKGFNALMAFSPDGQYIASCGQDFSMKLWDVKTGAEVAALKGHNVHVLDLAFSGDGKFLASLDINQSILLCDIVNLKQFEKQQPRSGMRLAFRPDEPVLATATREYGEIVVDLWDINNNQKVTSIIYNEFIVSSLSFNPRGNLLAIAGSGNKVKIFNLMSGEEKFVVLDDSSIYGMSFHPTEEILAVGLRKSNVIEVRETETNKLVKTLASPVIGSVNSVAFSPNGKLLAASYNGGVAIWNWEN